MALFDFFNTLTRSQTTSPTSFTFPEKQIVDEIGDLRLFNAEQSYFEVRLKQMYLKDKRVYWRGFRPFSTFATHFQHNGQWQDVPFIVGPKLLGSLANDIGDGAIEYRNLRVAGPYPYSGDDLRLFASLSRIVAEDWATRTLSLLETMVQTFDATKLSSYLPIAKPLVKGVEGFLGMKDVELRLAQLRAYEQPIDNSGRLRPNALQHRIELLLNIPQNQMPPMRKFWIKDDQLFFGDSPRSARPYRDADFMLLEIRPLSERQDYTTFSFHKTYWADTLKAIWQGESNTAKLKLRLTALSLVECADLIRPQRNALIKQYSQWFEEESQQAAHLFSMESNPLDGQEDAMVRSALNASLVQHDEAAFAAAVRGANDLRPTESILSELGL